MHLIITLIFAAIAIVCAWNWMLSNITNKIILWYVEKCGLPLPSEQDMKEGGKWVANHMVKDLTGRKNKN